VVTYTAGVRNTEEMVTCTNCTDAWVTHCVRYEVLAEAVTMKNVVFWDIKTQFVPHRRHITSPLQSPAR
jgi:hypothetical protein